MPSISNRGPGRRRTELYPNQNDWENPEPGRNNDRPDRRNQPIPISRATLTVIDGQGRTGIRIAALLAESFRLQLAKDEAKKLSRCSNKSEKETR